VLAKPGVSTALIGFAHASQVEEVVAAATRGPLDEDILRGMWSSMTTG
jgi:aryl-alcohol dehydrogenase-like predicted oxidoreductase